MASDTAVAAISSEAASARVASSSIPSRRCLNNIFAAMGDAKPTIPVSSVMIKYPSFANQIRDRSKNAAQCRQGFGRTLAKPLTNKGDSVGFG
jgi:hypothetical protein